MSFKTVSAAAVALAATLVSAQTFTDCNPLEKTCPSNPAFGNEKVNCDFTQGPCDAFDELDGTNLEFDENGAIFTIEAETNAPTIATHKYIFFGRVDVEVQAAPGQGIVTSAVLQSADLDEIDWEWVGGDTAQVQTNYFGKGDTTTYDRGAYHSVADPLTTTHTYSIEWTAEKIDWIIDGSVIRTLTYDEAQGGSRFPQTPMEVKLGTWVAGRKDAPEGTVEWAGGYTNFADAPFIAHYKSVSIVDYAGGSAPASQPIKEYVWTDRTGSWESIRVVKGDGSSDDGDDEPSSTKTSKTAEPTKTSSSKSTKTAEPTTTSEEETTTTEAATTTAEPTTMTTVTSETTSEAPATTSADSDEDASTGTEEAPAEETEDPEGAASRGAIFGSAIIATAGLMIAQFLL